MAMNAPIPGHLICLFGSHLPVIAGAAETLFPFFDRRPACSPVQLIDEVRVNRSCAEQQTQ
jgi:hypothetical protein